METNKQNITNQNSKILNGLINRSELTIIDTDVEAVPKSQLVRVLNSIDAECKVSETPLTEKKLEEIVLMNDDMLLSSLIIHHHILIKDDQLYINNDEELTKVENSELLQKIYKVLLLKNHYREAIWFLASHTGYKITSLVDLYIFSKDIRKRYVYSLLYYQHPRHPFYVFNKGMHFESLFNSVNDKDKVKILEDIIFYLTREYNSIRAIIEDGAKCVRTHGHKYLEFDIYKNDKVCYYKEINDLSFAFVNDTCTKLVNKISELEHSIAGLIK